MGYRFSFSYSSWELWKKCPAAYKYARIDKIETPEPPAFKKGREVHTAMEHYITGKRDTRPPEAADFSVMVDYLREWPEERKLVEQQMAFDRKQRPCAWFGPNTYARYIWDVAVLDDPKAPVEIDMVDWKTGKPRPGKNAEQMQLFSIPAFLLYPSLQKFRTHLVYLEHAEVESQTYTREQFEGGLNDLWRGNAAMMESDQSFTARPSQQACRFCDFHAKRGGPCPVGA